MSPNVSADLFQLWKKGKDMKKAPTALKWIVFCQLDRRKTQCLSDRERKSASDENIQRSERPFHARISLSSSLPFERRLFTVPSGDIQNGFYFLDGKFFYVIQHDYFTNFYRKFFQCYFDINVYIWRGNGCFHIFLNVYKTFVVIKLFVADVYQDTH